MKPDVKAIRKQAEQADLDGHTSHPMQVIALCDRVEALERALRLVQQNVPEGTDAWHLAAVALEGEP